MNKQKELCERFLRYSAISSQSDASQATVPSSKGQLELADLLSSELKELGLDDVFIDDHGIVYGSLPGNVAGKSLGFCAHLDTVDVGLSPEVHAKIMDYQGGDVVLNEEKNIVIKVAEHPELNDFKGERILFADGTSVLGADNKSAIANIMTALAYLKANPQKKRPTIKIAFVPDEEIGLRGSKLIDLNRFKVDYAYTIDSCSLGEVVYETFNAGSVLIEIEGVSAHPMSAKGVLVNPLLVAHDFIAMFDRKQTPECTEGKEGYWWFTSISSNPLVCKLEMHIRDHDLGKYQWRKQTVLDQIEALKKMHPRAKISCCISDTYENISNSVNADAKPIANIYKALEQLGITPKTYAMRGGTDGSALSARGIVTPNYFTGAHNFHSYAEFLPLSNFEKSLEVTLKLIELAAD